MIIKIFSAGVCVRLVEVDAEFALEMFNLVLLNLGQDESACLYSGDSCEHVIAAGC
jgi:hypothetical protein